MAKARVDWNLIEHEYVTGITENGQQYYPSQSDLAARYDIPIDTIGYHCRTKGWTSKREDYQRELEKKLRENRQKKVLDEMDQFETDIFQMAKILKSAVIGRLLVPKLDSQGSPTGGMENNPALSPADHKRYVDALPVLTAVVRDLRSGFESGKKDAFDELLALVERDRQAHEEEEPHEEDLQPDSE